MDVTSALLELLSQLKSVTSLCKKKRKENVKNYLKIPESNYFGEIGQTNEISQLEIKL